MTYSNSETITRSASWFAALRASIVFIVICGGLYPLVITSVGGLLFPHQATGSLIKIDGTIVGSELVGQQFKGTQYFHGRPSAVDYDAFSVGGSNLAASNEALRERVASDSGHIADQENVAPTSIPADLLAASGSGIDPHISPESARIQANRIADARQINVDEVNNLIKRYTENPTFGIFGQPRVNVLKINLALDGKESVN